MHNGGFNKNTSILKFHINKDRVKEGNFSEIKNYLHSQLCNLRFKPYMVTSKVLLIENYILYWMHTIIHAQNQKK